MIIREAEPVDLIKILKLYSFLHDDENDDVTVLRKDTWDKIMADPNHHVAVALVEDKFVSSCVCLIVPNLSRNGRPYALVENVVTDPKHRRKKYASQCLNFAKEIAKSQNCYKIMLLTGHKEKAVLEFYRRAGYNSEDKTAFIQWI